MLKHEPEQMPQNPAAPIPAAERRVSAEELAHAVSALEYAKAAERLAGVAPIGQVVDELGLDLTPEEIWAEVQRQRVQQVAENQVKQAAPAAASHAVTFQVRLGPPSRRSLAVRAVIAAGVLGLLVWVFTLNAAVQTSAPAVQTSAPALSGSTITISGDWREETIPVQGKDVCITGDFNNLILQGKAQSVTVSGAGNTLSGNAPEASTIAGGGNTIQWSGTP